MVDHRQVPLVDAITQKSGGLNRRMQAHLLGARENLSGEGKLHHGLAARYGQTPAELDRAVRSSPRRRST